MDMDRTLKKSGIRRVMLYAKLRKWIASDFHREYLKLEHRMRCNYRDAVYHSMIYGGTERIDKIFEV